MPNANVAKPSIRRSCAALLLVCLAWSPAGGMAASLAGQRFDDQIHLHQTALRLNGLGLRAVAWLKGFVAGLYLEQPTTDARAILDSTGPKRLRLKILLDAPAQEFVKAVRGGVRKNTTPDERAAMEPALASLELAIAGLRHVKKGDAIDLDWVPVQGLVLSLNGRPQAAPIANAALYRAVLKIFIGERPVDREMRAGLLRGPVAAPSHPPAKPREGGAN